MTQIDYGKHEKTVKELDRQEKEQEYERVSASECMASSNLLMVGAGFAHGLRFF